MKMEQVRTSAHTNSKSCIWMKAGVVSHKICRKDYWCQTCSYDRALQRESKKNKDLKRRGIRPEGKRGRIEFWKDRLRKLPALQRPCIHSLKNRIDHRTCINDYNCNSCEFNQYFEDLFTIFTELKPVDLMNIRGFKIPQGYYLHPGHTWVKILEESLVMVGLDEFILRVLGPLDSIELPLIGKRTQADKPYLSLHREGRQASVLCPVNGIVAEINSRLITDGSLAGQNPYGDDWVAKIYTTDFRRDLKQLMLGEETRDFLQQEVDILYEIIEESEGPLAADGGELAPDIYGNLSSMSWTRLTNLFLRSSALQQ